MALKALLLLSRNVNRLASRLGQVCREDCIAEWLNPVSVAVSIVENNARNCVGSSSRALMLYWSCSAAINSILRMVTIICLKCEIGAEDWDLGKTKRHYVILRYKVEKDIGAPVTSRCRIVNCDIILFS